VNNPLAVGLAVPHGCIRTYPEDIAALDGPVPVPLITEVSATEEALQTPAR
jgi:hypothetical protein